MGKTVRHDQWDTAWTDAGHDVQGRSVSERPKNGGDGEEGKDHNADQVGEDNHRPSPSSQRSVRHPDRDQRVYRNKCIPKGWILVLGGCKPGRPPS